MSKVLRFLRWYDSANETIVGEVELRGVDLPTLQQLVGAPPADLLYDCWPIPHARLPELAAFVEVPIASERRAYFLEANTES
ncbi:DUF7683 domain-containing protein [Fimbriiglobus ruber]|uniref:DUF7683 domain-containing protein n=1 Tax=Fimbriiglobus ruber TaxID=1908690 RepID=A0A225DVU7_9BACT|nr:hypothetical protein [Fimbriiglobus ruber]OWK45660.1 hypothetical protein FRUB_01991 [Fimbriiglobus ruber]